MLHGKRGLILLSAIFAAVGVGCNKDKQGTGYPPPPPPEKKVVVSTIAGEGTGGFFDGLALDAEFDSPTDVAVGPDGTLYIADFNNHRIRKLQGGAVTTLAGNDTTGVVDSVGGLAQFRLPYRIACDANGNVFVLDQINPVIRKISPTANVITYAGTGVPGFLNGSASISQFAISMEGIVTDGQGNVYVADTFNERIRKISTAGQVTTHAGSGTEGFRDGDTAISEFRFPNGITFDPQGNLYVADAGNFCIRKITSAGVVSKIAGTGTRGLKDGSADIAQFNIISDMVCDSQGNLYVTDGDCIRKVTPQGVVSTIAGSTAGFSDGSGEIAKFNTPSGLGIDAQGNIYVADANNNLIRKISFQ